MERGRAPPRKRANGSNGTTNGFYCTLAQTATKQSTNKPESKGPLLFHFTAQYYYVARELLVIPPPAAYCSRSRVFALVGPLLHIYLHIPVYLERQHSVP